jgi:uncharacterized protein YndB with AHSA1/START domain
MVARLEIRMEYGIIERELHIDAAPEVVYEVVSTPEHIRNWWSDDAKFDSAPGATGMISFGDSAQPDAKVAPLTVLEADPPRRFSFYWVYDAEPASSANALTVTFDLVPSGSGTLLRFTESGFRARWTGAEVEEAYLDHSRGWDLFLPRLNSYVARLVATP